MAAGITLHSDAIPVYAVLQQYSDRMNHLSPSDKTLAAPSKTTCICLDTVKELVRCFRFRLP